MWDTEEKQSDKIPLNLQVCSQSPDYINLPDKNLAKYQYFHEYLHNAYKSLRRIRHFRASIMGNMLSSHIQKARLSGPWSRGKTRVHRLSSLVVAVECKSHFWRDTSMHKSQDLPLPNSDLDKPEYFRYISSTPSLFFKRCFLIVWNIVFLASNKFNELTFNTYTDSNILLVRNATSGC